MSYNKTAKSARRVVDGVRIGRALIRPRRVREGKGRGAGTRCLGGRRTTGASSTIAAKACRTWGGLPVSRGAPRQGTLDAVRMSSFNVPLMSCCCSHAPSFSSSFFVSDCSRNAINAPVVRGTRASIPAGSVYIETRHRCSMSASLFFFPQPSCHPACPPPLPSRFASDSSFPPLSPLQIPRFPLSLGAGSVAMTPSIFSPAELPAMQFSSNLPKYEINEAPLPAGRTKLCRSRKLAIFHVAFLQWHVCM